MEIVVHADFVEDLRAELLARLAGGGYAVPPEVERDAMCTCEHYFNVRMRLLPSRRWKVRRSRELARKVLPEHLGRVVDAIEWRARNGESLRPFHHKPLADSGFNDALLNDWGIHHLHLGSPLPVQLPWTIRSKELLFVHATSEGELLLVDVRDHGSFVDNELLGIIRSNWPRAISDDEAVGATVDEGDAPPPEMRKALRKLGFTLLTRLADGTVYTPPGGGYMFNGLSSRVRMQADRTMERAHETEKRAREKAPLLANLVRKRAGVRLRELHLNLRLGAGHQPWNVIETQSKIVFPVGEG